MPTEPSIHESGPPQETGQAASLAVLVEPDYTKRTRCRKSELIAKWAVDRIVGVALLLLASPIIAVVCFAVWLEDRYQPIYRRRVVGQRGPFEAFKIRTMRPDADEVLRHNPQLQEEFERNFKLAQDPRITRCGRFLRKHNVDELPQLWNIVCGQMSLVGPRIKTAEEFQRYAARKEEVLSMKPGLTGYWQVTVRHRASYAERINLDLYYVRNWSLLLDLKIIIWTVLAVLRGRGD